jgi:DnaJ-class molecular chaperone
MKLCPRCDGAGFPRGKTCRQCEGNGWLSESEEQRRSIIRHSVMAYLIGFALMALTFALLWP